MTRRRHHTTASGKRRWPAVASTLVWCAMVLVSACPYDAPPPRPPVELQLQFVARGSCGRVNPLDYDTSCLAALHVRVLDVRDNPIRDRCVPIAEAPARMRDVLDGDPLLRLEGLSTNRTVRFEVRGMHDSDGLADTLCDALEQPEHWLFWGQSDWVDLASYDAADAGSPLIQVVLDCRDCATECDAGECFGCLALGGDTCPVELPASVCAPSSSLGCGIPCEGDGACFDGARRCVENVCERDANTGDLCSACSSDGAACKPGFQCVVLRGEAAGFCAPRCPDAVCASGTQCTRLGNGVFAL